MLVLGSTYAWRTFSDERVNRMETKRLDIDLIGNDFFVLDWIPESTTAKEIRVVNISESDAIVRISLEEFLVRFELDDQLEGRLKEVQTPKEPIDERDTTTWQTGRTYEKEVNRYFLSQEALQEAYAYPESTRNTLLAPLELRFVPDKVQANILPVDSEGYWLYEKGYFYYSEVLMPGEKSEILVSGIHLKAPPNALKFGLYTLDAKASGLSASKDSLAALWELEPTDLAYQLLYDKVY